MQQKSKPDIIFPDQDDQTFGIAYICYSFLIKCVIFFLTHHAVKTCVNGVQKNHLMETVALSTYVLVEKGRKYFYLFVFDFFAKVSRVSFFLQSLNGNFLHFHHFPLWLPNVWKVQLISMIPMWVVGRCPLLQLFEKLPVTFGLLSECNMLKLRQFGLGFGHFSQSPSFFSPSPSCKHPDNDLYIIV